MAILALFAVQGMSAAKYDEVIRRLEEAGAGAPPGRLHHTAYGDPANLQVADIYDSPESLQKFGETLMPILAAAGVDPGQPQILPVHNIVKG